jgi:hypothetical protein
MSFKLKEVRMLRCDLLHRRTGIEIELNAAVEIAVDGECRTSFSHTCVGKEGSGPWFSDSLSFADSWEHAMKNVDVLARHIEASHEVVAWSDWVVGR